MTEGVTLRGRVDRVFFSSPTFTTGKLDVGGGKFASFAGPFMVNTEDRVVLHGEWVEHPKFGRQVKVASFEVDQALDARGLTLYLARHPDFAGVGPHRARKIAEAFGDDFGRVIEEEPERVAEVGKVDLDRVKTFRKKWLETKELNASMSWLAGLGITAYQSKALIDEFGASVGAVLKKDPYLIQRAKGFGFKRADEIARKMGMPEDHPSRIGGAIQCVLEERKERRGDCFVEGEELMALVAGLAPIEQEKIAARLDELLAGGQIVSVDFEDEEGTRRRGIGLKSIFEMEKWLAGFFTKARELTNRHADGLKMDEGETVEGAQKLAVDAARKEACCLITGGAGSGKTFTVAAIVRMYARAGLRVALAAPTGKAARRIEEVAEHEAFTIHRLLEFKGAGFERRPGNELDCDVVIVDELSMLDVWLAWNLFRAVDLAKTAVVLVGDPNQLPPVGPGNVLRDLIKRKMIACVKLDKIHRQAGTLRENSAKVLEAVVVATAKAGEDGAAPWNVARTKEFRDGAKVKKYVLGLFEGVLSERLGFDLLRDVQVLTPKHEGQIGTIALNAALQRLVQKKCWGVDVDVAAEEVKVDGVGKGAEKRGQRRRAKFYLNDRVIQTRNDYDLDVMNGSVGMVVGVGDKELVVEFDGEEKKYGRDKIGDLELAYALTIHKAQGSEFPCVVLIVHREHAFMHHRGLLYTGVTRARKSVVIVGDHEGIDRCAKKGEVDRRRTFLSVIGGSG